MGYLDSAGLSTFWNKVKAILSGKQNALTAGNGITLQDSTVSVTTPVKGLTQAEYNALNDEEKKAGYYIVTDSNISLDTRGDVYSTTETRIGTWIDEKPLYRRVFQFICPDGDTVMPDTKISDLDYVKCEGVVSYGDNDELYPLPYCSGYNVLMLAYVKTDSGGGIRVTNSMADFSNCPMTVIVTYTKTTDTVPLNTLSFGLPVETNDGPSEEYAELAEPIKTATSVVMPSVSSVETSNFATASASSAKLNFAPVSASSAKLNFAPVSASSAKLNFAPVSASSAKLNFAPVSASSAKVKL